MGIVELIRAVTTNIPVQVYPVLTVFFLLVFFVYYVKILRPRRGTSEWIDMELHKPNLNFFVTRHPLEVKDIAPLLIITAIFMFLAVFNLGHTTPVDVTAAIASPGEFVSHMSDMYFDEVFFVRTAVEHIELLPPFETTHPPLGKEIIASSILLFGMSPFGWRLMGAILGVVMLIVMYLFIKGMFGKTAIAVCGTLLLGFDFMRFVQSRLATVDTFLVLFILLAFYFMYRHVTTDPDAPLQKSLVPLAFSGFFFGLSFAVKWIGFFAGFGLLVIYAIRLVQLGIHYKNTKNSGFVSYLTKTLLWSVLFFVVIPLKIYYITYIPYGLVQGMTIAGGMLWDSEYFRLVLDNQILMFRYHSIYVIGAEHPFSSTWWQWVFNTRPVLYVNTHAGGTRATFGAFGNPVVWWGGLLAMLTMLIRVFTHRDGKALFILIGYLANLLPWLTVTRILFAYHYFPSVLFIVLAFAHIFNTMFERKRNFYKLAVYGYTALAGVVFAMFYPSISGMYMPFWYYTNLIRWLGSWPF